MNCATFRRSRLGGGTAVKAALVAALLTFVAAPSLAQTVRDKYEWMRQRREESRFRLFAEPTLVLQVNQYQCGLRNQGDTCSDVFNSPTGGGGFWPTGSPNQYMFNSGINIAGIIPAEAGFVWAGDTVGAFFFDATGQQPHGQGLTDIYNSMDPDDLANWPDELSIPDFPDVTAYVVDEELFNPVLLGRKAASQQDSWVMYWDGDPSFLAHREHAMGITVEQRSLGWNFPSGNEATIYFIYKFTNITNNPMFQLMNEAHFFGGANELPDGGWRIDSIYVSADFDPDVTTDFDKNYSTAILPFNMGVAYEGEFLAPDFTYFPDLFYPPFFTNAPGLVGAKYLRSPVDPATGEEVGLTLFTVHENPSSPGARFSDPYGVQQLWRYLSGNVTTGLGDPPCTFPNPKERRLCFLADEPKDTRFLQASGPFSLEPGESQTVVVAQFAAATVETGLIVPGNAADNPPGVPSLRPGCETEEIRPIEVGAGWISTQPEACAEVPAPGKIDEFKVNFVPGSLLGKALVAQTIFNNKFLLGFAPERPNFFLVAGDDQVTVVWEETSTEQDGDPFFAAAGDPDNALYNPNYRQFDVEGYRIYRGSDPAALRLIAQFDKTGSVFVDHTCETDPTFVAGDECTETVELDIASPFVQYPVGGVVRLEDGSPFVASADTAMDLADPKRTMTNTGIPFAFVDRGVRNGFQYFYKVTAFDINSLRSGPTSLESAGLTKSAFPQRPAADLTEADYEVGLFGTTGELLDTERTVDPATGEPAPYAIDPQTGRFTGRPPATQQLSGVFQAFAPNLLSTGSFEITLDSVVPFYYGGAYFFTGPSGEVVQVNETGNNGFSNVINGMDLSEVFQLPTIRVPSDPQVRQQLAGAGIEAPPVSGSMASQLEVGLFQWQSADADWAYLVPGFWTTVPPEGSDDGGSRWFSGENETMADPTLGLAHGALDGVDVIFEPVPYYGVTSDYVGTNGGSVGADHVRRFFQSTWPARRVADIEVRWGGSGVDEVYDVSHDVPVPFSPAVRASYGFLTDSDGDGVLTHADFYYIPGLETTSNIGQFARDDPQPLVNQPVFMSVDIDGDLAGDGTGFGLYIAGEPYLFQTSAVPSNTTWTLRTHAGSVIRDASGNYRHGETYRTPGVPGLRIAVSVNSRAEILPETADLSLVHTVPDPYYAVSQFDLSPASKNLRFVNLPARCTIRIYSVAGVLVDVINHDDPSGGGQETWDLRNRSNQFVASGVYFYHITTPTGDEHIGKFTVINYAH